VNTLTDLVLLPTTDPGFWQDPHAAVRRAHERGPVARSPWDSLVLLDYDDCLAVLADTRFANDYDTLLTRHDVVDGPLWDWWQLAMLNNNPPVHTRLRSLVSRAFTPRSVARAAAPTRRIAEELLEPALERGRVELVSEVCAPLPIAVMCELIGVPRDRHADFDFWVSELGLMFSANMTAETRERAEQGMANLYAAISALIEQRRTAGDAGDDLLGDLIAAEDGGDRLSRDELVAMIVNLLFGALDTTRGALSLAVDFLVRHPDALRTLRDDRSILKEGVDELLRIEPPIIEIARVATVDTELHGHTVASGDVVGLSVLAANCDPTRFAQPDVFDPRRFAGGSPQPILTFGRGIHHCVGAALARIELHEALDVILDCCRVLEPAGPPPRRVPFLAVRCMETLPLVVAG
jgi:cytochrome P450